MAEHTTRRWLAAAVAGLALTTAACSGTAATPTVSGSGASAAYAISTTTPTPSGDIDSFTWSLYSEPFSLDYAYAFDYSPNQVLSNVCESLLRWNPDLSVSPGLAESVTNPTPTTWVYTIRQGVTFHDGSPLTADDVVASLTRHLDPAVGSFWGASFLNVKTIEKTGANEVTVTLNAPDSMFNQAMATSAGTVESAKTLEASGKDYGNASAGVNCSGPFAFDSWKPGENITLKRYDAYWDADLKAKSGEVEFVFLSDPNTRVNAWVSGEVDGGFNVPANAYTQLQGSGSGSLYYGINTAVVDEIVNLKGALADKRVRQALLMATDRAGILKTAEQGVGEVAESLVNDSTWGSLPKGELDAIKAELPKYEYDVAGAKALAKEAGVNGQKVVIATTPAFQAADVITAAISQAAKDIGLVPEIRTISPDKYGALFTDPAAREGVDLFLTVWYTSTTDPLEFYGVLRSGQFSNYGGYANPAFDELANKAVSTAVDDPARVDLIADAQQIAMGDLPWLPLYTLPANVWLGNRITGLKPSIAFLYYPWAATVGAK